MSNKITFSEPGKAKLSWKVYDNNGIVSDKLDAVRLFINGKAHEVENTEAPYEFDIDKDATFHVNVTYNGMTATSGKLEADYVGDETPDQPGNPDQPDQPDQPDDQKLPCYYGTMIIEPNNTEHDLTDDELTSVFQTYYDSLDLESLVDSNPLSYNGSVVSNPSKLVKTTSINPVDNKFEFVCAEFNKEPVIDQSRPVVIYPKSYGEVSQIIDDMQTNGINNFIKIEIDYNNGSYLVYTLKNPNSLATDDGYTLPYTFKK